jgi:putative phosphoserine phosphatase/1-acylglycerol-3-phosphate O-acyltransferase
MADIDWLIDRVEKAPNGPGVAAFFDFDGTLIDGFSAGAFFKSRMKHGDIGVKELAQSLTEAVNVERRGHNIDQLMRIVVEAQKGQKASDIDEWARRIFAKRISGMLFPEARLLIEAHQEKGHTVVVASSATAPQIQASAEDLGIPNIICTEMAIDEEGYMTGELSGPIRWGEGKAQGVDEFAQKWSIKLDDSFSYSNGGEDVPFLETTGNPCALNPDSKLARVAKERDWPIAFLHKPQKVGPVDLIRTSASLGAFGTSLFGATIVGLAQRNRVDAANFASHIGAGAALAFAGVDLKVVGEENLWEDRPAIFIFNHQSQLDAFVTASLIKENFTGVAKKQLAKSPIFAPLGYLGDVAYVDRSNHDKAIHQLDGVVEKLQGGTSIVIAPEGTRSATARLGPFKKGPFHMAMQAGVPLVPIIMRNCGELMAAHSYVIHSGSLDVAVLPPIYTDDWTLENLDDEVEGVRQKFIDVLTDWPKG